MDVAMDQILNYAVSLGISGLLFVMWWLERQERTRVSATVHDATLLTERLTGVNDQLLEVIQQNTEALTALRGEIRSHRMFEADWIKRLSQQLEKLGAA